MQCHITNVNDISVTHVRLHLCYITSLANVQHRTYKRNNSDKLKEIQANISAESWPKKFNILMVWCLKNDNFHKPMPSWVQCNGTIWGGILSYSGGVVTLRFSPMPPQVPSRMIFTSWCASAYRKIFRVSCSTIEHDPWPIPCWRRERKLERSFIIESGLPSPPPRKESPAHV